MPKKIQEALTSLKLIKRFGLVGGFSPQLDETVVPVVLLDDLTVLEQWRYAFCWDEQAWVVAQRPTWQLHNPEGSGKVLQLLRWTWYDDEAQTVNFFVNDVSADMPNVLEPQFEEVYEIVLAADEFPTAEFRVDLVVGIMTGPQVYGVYAAANTPVTWEPKHVLIYPGASVWVQPTVVAQGGAMSWEWRERNQRPDGS